MLPAWDWRRPLLLGRPWEVPAGELPSAAHHGELTRSDGLGPVDRSGLDGAGLHVEPDVRVFARLALDDERGAFLLHQPVAESVLLRVLQPLDLAGCAQVDPRHAQL